MWVLFNYQEVLEIVNKGVPNLPANATDVQRQAHKEARKKDCKALFLIHQCVDSNNFEKISSAETSKAAWDILQKCYAGAEKVKKVRLQTLRKQYENMSIEEQESAATDFSQFLTLVNLMKACGETFTKTMLVEKVLKSLTSRFDYIVVAIEESKDLGELKLDDLQSSIEAHEQRLNDRHKEKDSRQTLQAHTFKKSAGESSKGTKQKLKPNKGKGLGSDQSNNQKPDEGNSRRKGVHCYNCQKFGHFADECRGKCVPRKHDEVQLCQEEDSSSDAEKCC